MIKAWLKWREITKFVKGVREKGFSRITLLTTDDELIFTATLGNGRDTKHSIKLKYK